MKSSKNVIAQNDSAVIYSAIPRLQFHNQDHI